jgi:hypothetical protein
MFVLSKKQTTMKQILLFALMTFFVQTSFCQNLSDTVNVEYSKNSPKRFSISGGLSLSALAWHSLPNLNQFLKTQDISNDNLTVYIPFGINYQINRLKLQIMINYGIAIPSNYQNNYSTTLKVNNLSISTGYAIFADRNKYIYFNLGVGSCKYTETINKYNQQITSLASALQNSIGQSITLQNTQSFIDIGIEYLNRTKGKRLGQSVRLGYRYGLEETPWSSQFIRLSDVPSDRIGSVYLETLLNIPSVSKKHRNNLN